MEEEEDLKQFKYITTEKQTPGIKRSITTAAFLAFILPILINIVTEIYPYIEYPITITKKIKDKKNKIVDINITNNSKNSIDSMIINFKYYNNKLIHHQVHLPENTFIDISVIGKQPPEKNNKPYRGSFLIKNFPGKKTITLSFTLTESAKNFDVENIVKDGAKIVYGSYPTIKANFAYWLITIVAIGLIILGLLFYGISLWNAHKLQKCLNVIVRDLNNITRKKPAWYNKPIAYLYNEYWENLMLADSRAPKELKNFYDFLRQKNMLYSNSSENVIWIAPFDMLGSPTFTKLFGSDKTALFIKLDDRLNVIDIKAKTCGELLQ